MQLTVHLVFGAAFIILAAVTMGILLRAILRGAKRGVPLPYQPIPVVFPPIPVRRTAGLAAVAAAAIAWSLLHVMGLVFWPRTAERLGDLPANLFTFLYVGGSAVLVGVGGVLLLACRPKGRRLISWGLLLLGLLAFFGLVAAVALPQLIDAPQQLRRIAPQLMFIMAGHILFDTAVGGLAQRVGRVPPGEGAVPSTAPLPSER